MDGGLPENAKKINAKNAEGAKNAKNRRVKNEEIKVDRRDEDREIMERMRRWRGFYVGNGLKPFPTQESYLFFIFPFFSLRSLCVLRGLCVESSLS
jgi:hypothetical protein